jgi:hypothetical protein
MTGSAWARRLSAASWYAVAAAVLLTPLVIAPAGKDRYRLVKDLLLVGDGILLIAIGLLAVVWGLASVRPYLRDPRIVTAGAIVAWTAVAALLSSNQRLSVFALMTVTAAAAFFTAAYLTARDKPLAATALAVVPAIPNAILVMLQETGTWNPFAFDGAISLHEMSTALIGNPNDVGSYLVAPTMAAIVLTMADKKRRAVWAAAAALLVAALLFNRTLTALIAFTAGVCTLAAVASRRRLLTTAVIAIAAVATLATVPPLRQRAVTLAGYLRAGEYDTLLTGRGTPNLAAARMAREHPLTGVGPGCFKFEYYPYKLEVEQDHPRLLTSAGRTLNFSQTHNDHLQVMAETGLPGYLLLLAALVQWASLTFRPRGTGDSRAEFARLLSLPLAVTLFVLMLAQFPLQLAAPTVAFTYLAAICCAWSPRPE